MKRYCLFFTLFIFSITLQAQEQAQLDFKLGKGISLLASDSSAYTFLRVWMQPQFTAEKRLTDGASWTSDMGVQRARLNFIGWLKNPKFGYQLQMMLAPPELKTGIDATAQQEGYTAKMMIDAAINWKFHPNVELWFGQQNILGSFEGAYPAFLLQMVNKSIFHSTFNYNREVGVQLRGSFGEDIVIRPHFRMLLGDGRNITTGNQGGLQYIARVEVLPFGKFTGNTEYAAADLKSESTPKLAAAITLDFNHNASRQRGNAGKFITDDEGNLRYTTMTTFLIDAVFKYQGISALGSYAVRTAADDTLGFHEANGLNLEAGYMLKDNYQVVLRYGNVLPIGNKVFAGSQEYIVGISKYIAGHILKVQSDIGLIRNSTTEVTSLRYRFQITAGF